MNNLKVFLEKYRTIDLKNIKTEDLEEDLRLTLNQTPFPTVSLKLGERLERIRNNYNGEVFYSIDDITYRRDLENITEYGRANCPNQAIFYASTTSDPIKETRVTNVLETNNILRNKNLTSKLRQVFTSGQWVVKQRLNLVIFPFHHHAIINNELIRHSVGEFSGIINDMFSEINRPLIMEVLTFFSDEFARTSKDNIEDYRLTALLSNFLYKNDDIDGILYPSVRADYQSQNIALHPKAIPKLELDKAAIFELIICNKEALIDVIAVSLDLGSDKRFFNWAKQERMTDKQIKGILKCHDLPKAEILNWN